MTKLSKEQKTYNYNTVIFDIANNLLTIKRLYNKYKQGKLNSIYDFEKRWINFLISEKIDIFAYDEKEIETFLTKWLKKIK